jgi:hypothetical protein
MSLDILCEIPFSPAEEEKLSRAAELLQISKEEVVRRAVALFSSQCVPTQKEAR